MRVIGRFKQKLLEEALQTIMAVLLKRFTPEKLKEGLDKFFDWVEDACDESPNPYDNVLIKKPIEIIREAFDIPDNDDETTLPGNGGVANPL
jgi:hypothetical protein